MLHFSIVPSNNRNVPAWASEAVPSFTARSVVLSLLLGSHPPALPVASLVDFCGLFDIAPGTVRTALSRMVERGELSAGEATYQLTGRLLTRQTEQDIGRRRLDDIWDGTWHLAIVTAERRSVAERREFRTRAVGAKLGELRPDVWLRPANLVSRPDVAGCLTTTGHLDGLDPEALVHQLWPLDDIDRESEVRSNDLDRAARELERSGTKGLAATFVTLALALRQLRIEPQLPAQLHRAPAGDRLRTRYAEVERAFRRTLRAFLDQ